MVEQAKEGAGAGRRRPSPTLVDSCREAHWPVAEGNAGSRQFPRRRHGIYPGDPRSRHHARLCSRPPAAASRAFLLDLPSDLLLRLPLQLTGPLSHVNTPCRHTSRHCPARPISAAKASGSRQPLRAFLPRPLRAFLPRPFLSSRSVTLGRGTQSGSPCPTAFSPAPRRRSCFPAADVPCCSGHGLSVCSAPRRLRICAPALLLQIGRAHV